MSGGSPSAHQAVERFRRSEAGLHEVRRDGCQRRTRAFADDLVVIDADDLDLVGDGNAADAADFQQELGTPVVDGEDAARLLEQTEPVREG